MYRWLFSFVLFRIRQRGFSVYLIWLNFEQIILFLPPWILDEPSFMTSARNFLPIKYVVPLKKTHQTKVAINWSHSKNNCNKISIMDDSCSQSDSTCFLHCRKWCQGWWWRISSTPSLRTSIHGIGLSAHWCLNSISTARWKNSRH